MNTRLFVFASTAPVAAERACPQRSRMGVACSALTKTRLTVFALSAVLTQAALAQSPAASNQESSRSLNTASAAPSAAALPPIAAVSAPSGYILSPNDQVAVEVFGEEDLRTNGRLNAEGNLSVPLIGSVHLAGLTLTQASAKLTDLFGKDYLVNPRVNVMLIGYAKRRFTMLGQVNRPGSYEMPEGSPEGIDLLEAVAVAGGYSRIAAPERISVRRGNQILRVNAKRLARGGHENFTVLPGDTVTVGESLF
jgi:polysaccharide export outer membrane protein